jgi:hypothetical protein
LGSEPGLDGSHSFRARSSARCVPSLGPNGELAPLAQATAACSLPCLGEGGARP